MASLEIIKLEWVTPIFKVVEHSQDGLYILLQGQISWQSSGQTYDLDEGNMLFLRRGSYAVRCGTKEPCQLSIVDIAMEAGFSSQSYFTQSYRRRFGCTPSQARLTKIATTG